MIGLTSGIAAKASRPSAASAASVATTASSFARRMRALIPPEGKRERDDHERERAELPAHGRASPASRRGASIAVASTLPRSSAAPCSGRSAPPAPSRMRAVSVAKYQPPARISRDRPVGDHASLREQHRTVGEVSGELGVVRGDQHRAARRGALAQPAREQTLGRAVHPACRLVQREHRRGLLAAEHDREREALALSAGEVARMARGEIRQPDKRERRRGRLGVDALVQEVIARVLQQQRDAARAAHAAPGRREQTARRGAAAWTCRRRCGPSGRRSRRRRDADRRHAGSRARRAARARRRRSSSAAVGLRAPALQPPR